jgi:hypothetical protein
VAAPWKAPALELGLEIDTGQEWRRDQSRTRPTSKGTSVSS